MLPRSLRSRVFRLSKATYATKVHRLTRPGDVDDFRPPWFYTASRVLLWTLIPYAAFYGTFFYDFGDRDHVFRPARAWLDKQKTAFFSISPEDEKILMAESTTSAKHP